VERGRYVFTPENVKVHEFEHRVQDFIYNHRDKIQDSDRAETGHNLAENERGALTAHGLRHSYARERYEELVEELKENLSDERAEKVAREQVAEELGHGRDTVTFIYTLLG
jgi:integrase